MKTTDLQQEFIENPLVDLAATASSILGCLCSSTTAYGGDGRKEDKDKSQYQIIPDARSAKNADDAVIFSAFENYFYDNYGKWKDRCYFDSPSEAFSQVIKAWHIWNNHLTSNVKEKYLDHANKRYKQVV